MKEWYIQLSIINSKLESYFHETDTKKSWEKFSTVLLSFNSASRQFFQEDPNEEKNSAIKKRLKYNLESLRSYFQDNKEIDWDDLLEKLTIEEGDLWYTINNLFDKRGEEIIKDALKLSIKDF